MDLIRLLLVFLLFMPPAFAGSMASTSLLSAATATGAGASFSPRATPQTYQATGATGSGSGAATIKIQVSDVPTPTANDWLDLGTITLTLGVTSTTDGFTSSTSWRHVRANVTAISGTSASVYVYMGTLQ